MSHLILLRHAKSISLLNEMDDFKRILNEKGRHDVPKVANAFKKTGIMPDIILCSAAYRTKETLELFVDALHLKVSVVYLNELYHASASSIFEIILNYSPYKNIMVVGHNFGISDLANHISTEGAQEMNTCGLYVFHFKQAIEFNKGTITHYFSPKNI